MADKNIKTLRRAIKKARLQMHQQQADAANLYNRGVGDSDYVAGEVQNFLTAQQQKIAQGYADTANKQKSSAQALQGIMQTNTDQARGNINAEQARLGLGAVGTGNLDADSNFAKLQAMQAGQNAQDNTNAAGQNADAISGLLQGMNQGQRQANMGTLANMRADNDNTIRNTFAQFKTDQLGRIQDYKAEKAAREAAAKAYRSHYRRYSGGGGHSSFVPYGHSGGSSSGSGDQYSDTVDAQLALMNSPKPSKAPKAPKPKASSGSNPFSQLFGSMVGKKH